MGQEVQGQTRLGHGSDVRAGADEKSEYGHSQADGLDVAFEALKLVTHDNAQLLALSGPRNPYPGKLGVIEQGALADMLLVDGDPIANLKLIADPGKNFVVIMKDGRIYKNSLQ